MDKDTILDLLADTGSEELYKKLMSAKDVDQFIEQNIGELRKVTGWAEIEKPTKSNIEQILANMNKFNELPDVYKQEMAKKLGIDYDTFTEDLAKINKSIEYQEGRKRREKEISEAGFLSPWTLASDYSKQRYIDDPNTSMFGKEGSFNPYSTEGQKEIQDFILGATGAVGDAIPGIGGVVLGPTARAVRAGMNDNLSAGDIVADVGTNVGTSFLPTLVLNKGKKLLTNAKGEMGSIGRGIEDVQEALTTDAELEAIKKGLDIGYEGATHGLKKSEKWVKTLPDSPFKEEMKRLIKQGVSEKELIGTIESWQRVMGDDFKYFANKNLSKEAKALEGSLKDVAYSKATRPDIEGPWSKLAYMIGKSYPTVGEATVKDVATAKGRGTKPEPDKYERWRKGYVTIDELKSQEYNDWKLQQLMDNK